MPNHVINEVIFSQLTADLKDRLKSKLINTEGAVDFQILLPIPINIWWHGVGLLHEKTFPDNAIDWCTNNWGTKWNAYGQDSPSEAVTETEDSLVLHFQTAWRAPMGWLVAIYNSFNISFDYGYLSEGDNRGVVGYFKAIADDFDRWKESPADGSMQRHLHKLLWGVEAFSDEEQASHQLAAGTVGEGN